MTHTQKAEQMARKPVKNRAGITPKETWHKATQLKWFTPNLCNGRTNQNAAWAWEDVTCPACIKKKNGKKK